MMIHKNVYRPHLPKIAYPIALAALGTLNSSAEAIELSGDVLQFALPAMAMGATLGHRNEEDGRLWDRTGSLQFVESAALTLGVTYALKYGLDTTRPNGSPHSMPSGHTSISFSSAEYRTAGL
jgi:membrane-associated phospholipid phosphatase